MRFPINTVRSAFPALQASDAEGIPHVFFDNPAGTQVPAPVAIAISDAILYANANLGGHFTTSIQAGRIYDQAHRCMAEFLGADDGESSITIGQSMTSLTYQFSRALARDWQAGDEIIITTSDHDGNVSPWVQAAADKGVTVKRLAFDANMWQLLPEHIEPLLSPRTKLVALNYANNMTGSINPLQQIIALVHQAGALAYVDAVQYAPHRQVDVQALDCDFLACSSYKFFGPHLGIVYTKPEILDRLHAYKVRPAPDQGSGKFAHGTPQIELLAGLIATVDYFIELGHWVAEAEGLQLTNRQQAIKLAYDASVEYEEALSARLISGLQQLPVQIMGISTDNMFSRRVPTVSVVPQSDSTHRVAQSLADRGVFCWSGHNYALETAHQLQLDMQQGVVRLGMAHYNTLDEVDRVLHHLQEILG